MIAPHYGGEAPMAALVLDSAIDAGHLGVLEGPDGGHILPLQQAAESMGADSNAVRDSMHRLHAHGAFLVEEYEDKPFIRSSPSGPTARAISGCSSVTKRPPTFLGYAFLEAPPRLLRPRSSRH
ncbi:hypothetical protein ACH4FX_41925 [Streptomyces sp. NPDC018019]|uniref:hypothetical protein n=1 Tax=Streptomyces sp. NPDC018019 TaxID=3365030 RepID=UPI003792DA82